MYLDVVVIDILTPKGIMTSYKIIPQSPNESVVIDKIRDIFQEKFGKELDVGGTRIYNLEKCSITRSVTKLRKFETHNDIFSFTFDHMGLPIGDGGVYNLILPSGLRLTDFRIVDPYDSKHQDIREKKEFRYEVIWDTKHEVQLIEMILHSKRGSFSFIVDGSFCFTNSPAINSFKDAIEYNWKVSHLVDNYYMLTDDEKRVFENEVIGRFL
jgi:hypothetical protein